MKIQRIDFWHDNELGLDVYLRIRKEGFGQIDYSIRMPYDPEITLSQLEQEAIRLVEEMERELRQGATLSEEPN